MNTSGCRRGGGVSCHCYCHTCSCSGIEFGHSASQVFRLSCPVLVLVHQVSSGAAWPEVNRWPPCCMRPLRWCARQHAGCWGCDTLTASWWVRVRVRVRARVGARVRARVWAWVWARAGHECGPGFGHGFLLTADNPTHPPHQSVFSSVATDRQMSQSVNYP